MKLLNDTLKSPNGKWSRKSIILMLSFVASLFLGGYIVIKGTNVNTLSVEVFQSFLLLVGAMSGVTVWDKQTLHKNNSNTNFNQDA